MWTILDHLSLAQNRTCKNRPTLQRALNLAIKQNLNPILVQTIRDTLPATNALATQLDTILNCLPVSKPPSRPYSLRHPIQRVP